MPSSKPIYRVNIIGLEASGKTQLFRKLHQADTQWERLHMPTIEREVCVLGGKLQPLQIWDNPGREQYQNIISPYIRGSAILLVTLSCGKDFDSQLMQLKAKTDDFSPNTLGVEQMRKLLVFTKLDGENTLTEEQILRASEVLGIKESFTCSAKENINIQVIKDKLFAMRKEIALADKTKTKLFNFNSVLSHIKTGGFWENHKTTFTVLTFATLGIFFGFYKLSMYLENRKVPNVSTDTRPSTTSTSMRGVLGSGDYSETDKRQKTVTEANSVQTVQVELSSEVRSNNCFRRFNSK